MLIRYLKIFHKYGGILSLWYLAKWILFKINSKVVGKRICIMKSGVFKPIGQSKFKMLYVNNKEDIHKVLKGDRKILFYEEDDECRDLDIKVEWELKRSHHGPILSIQENKSGQELMEILLNESNLNNILHDSNAMEVGIAAINILNTYLLLSEQRKNMFSAIVSHHLKNSLIYIFSYNEKGIIFSNNHYFFNLISSLWILESIKGNTALEKIKKRTYKKLKHLLKQIINHDGSLYEGSTHYHKYVTDTLLLFLVFISKSQINDWLLNYAKTMYLFCCYASLDNKLIGLGDNDSGRILALPKYFNYSSSDLSLTHKVAGMLGFNPISDKEGDQISSFNLSNKSSFGLFKLHNKNWDVAIRCEQTRNKNVNGFIGSHFHNDQLSLISNYLGNSIFVDTGVYSYIPKCNTRIINLKTASHNTLVVDNLEQNVIFNDWRYSKRGAVGEIISCNQTSFEGKHNGYTGIIHHRKIEIDEKLIIQDSITSDKQMSNYSIKIYFHLHPDVKPLITKAGKVQLSVNGKVLLMETNKNAEVSIELSRYSPEYGLRIKTFAVVIAFEKNKFQTCLTEVTPVDHFLV